MPAKKTTRARGVSGKKGQPGGCRSAFDTAPTTPALALCVGINYKGSDHQLNGCLNDANDWSDLLQKQGFQVERLLEEKATLENMVLRMSNLVASLKPGETGAITYSGHGTWLPDLNSDEPDGRDEALVPFDVGDDGTNLLIDDDIGLMFDKLAQGARIIFVTDSCHSGTVFRFMPLPWERKEAQRLVRFLPPSHFVKDDALLRRVERAYSPSGTRSAASQTPSRGLVHFSGCMDTEYSSDAFIGGRHCGAFSYFALRAFKKGGTYREIWTNIRQNLPNYEYQQTPLLNALPGLKDLCLYR